MEVKVRLFEPGLLEARTCGEFLPRSRTSSFSIRFATVLVNILNNFEPGVESYNDLRPVFGIALRVIELSWHGLHSTVAELEHWMSPLVFTLRQLVTKSQQTTSVDEKRFFGGRHFCAFQFAGGQVCGQRFAVFPRLWV